MIVNKTSQSLKKRKAGAESYKPFHEYASIVLNLQRLKLFSSAMDNKVIEVSRLAKNFGSFEAVRDVSFTVQKGDVFGFLGPNGAGKSTTIRCMLSLIAPSRGEVKLFGKPLGAHRSEVLRKVGSIIEKPDFYKYLSAERNLELFSRISGGPTAKKEIHKMLDFVGLKGREGDKVSGFSHGMKQRLGIAQTLIHDPELIVLDEPTTGLDPQGIIDIRNLIMQLKSEHKKTVILSSHILSEIEIIANRMVIINKGKSIIEGEVSELLNAEDLIATMEVDDVRKTARLIADQLSPAKVISTKGNTLQIATERDAIPNMLSQLSASGIKIFSLESKRKLEDYFIKMIKS
jgi:ABC-type multidrug transport system ATPase subunit